MTTNYDLDYGINRDSLFVKSASNADYRFGSKNSYLDSSNSEDSEDDDLSAEMIDNMYLKKRTNKRIVKVRKSDISRKPTNGVRKARPRAKSSQPGVNLRAGSKSQRYSKQDKTIQIDSGDKSKGRSKSGSKTGSKTNRYANTLRLNDPNVDAVLNSQLMTRSKVSKKYATVQKRDETSGTSGTSDPSVMRSEDNNSMDNTSSVDTGDTDDTKSSDGSKKRREKDPVPIKNAIKDTRDRARYVDVRRFFRNPKKCSQDSIQIMVDIINSNHEISLRNLNWFGTKHLDTMDSRYRTNDNGDRELFDPKISYGKRQGPYGKKGFDPFRRGLAFNWNYDPNDKTKTVITTLCQLQFFKWLFEYEMMTYILENLIELKDLQSRYEKRKKEEKKAKKVKKDKESEKEESENTQNAKRSGNTKNLKLKAKRTDNRVESKLVIKIG
jgi:hypothetical protein